MGASTWQHCYRDSWTALVMPASFNHPAKFARGLIHRLYRHLLDQGYVQPGQTILDPFGGVALGALDAQTYGLKWLGVELEPHFVATGQSNLDLWARHYGFLQARLLQGDSRQLREVLAGYGIEGGAIVSSPPYAAGCRHTGGQDRHPEHIQSPNKHTLEQYGPTEGQLGSLPPGSIDHVISSPPYATGDTAGPESLRRRTDKSAQAMLKDQHWTGGGQTAPQNLARQTQQTFWTAAHQVMAEGAALLPAGGIAAWVVKQYVAKKTLVDFPGQWARLCQSHGLALIETIQASLVEELGTQQTLWGEPEVQRVKTASFFRRLAEKKGSPRIDHETVLICRKGA